MPSHPHFPVPHSQGETLDKAQKSIRRDLHVWNGKQEGNQNNGPFNRIAEIGPEGMVY